MKHAISARGLASPSHARSHLPHNFGAHMKIWFNINVKIPMLIKWPYRFSPKSCWLWSLEWVSIFWARTPISFKHMMPLWCPFSHPHLTTCHSNIGVQIIFHVGIRHVYLNLYSLPGKSLVWSTKLFNGAKSILMLLGKPLEPSF
jgi:hypothetical protein